ncbi:uncharacterized protein LOC108604065 [Drosophila busckii]|nr:uncharacterized protein LOC108604065 [Drosophila busckii]
MATGALDALSCNSICITSSTDEEELRVQCKRKIPCIEDLPIDLWLEFMSYLSYLDLQQLRLVNWHCRNVVNRRYFLHKAKVIVTQDNITQLKKHVECGACYLSFEHVELRDMITTGELVQLLQLVGKHVKHLQMVRSPVFCNIDGRLPNLQSLQIATTTFDDNDTSMYVDGLDLKQFTHLNGFECDGVSLDPTLKLLMLMQLRRRENRVRLRHLQYEYRRNNEPALLQVLYDHSATLQCVDLFFSCTPGIDTTSWGKAFERMLKLKTLKLSGNCHMLLLEEILRAIPARAPLRNLDLTGMLSLTNDILLRVAKKWPRSLRYLDCMFCVQLDDRCMEALQLLSGSLEWLSIAYCRGINGGALAEGLTTQLNDKLQQLNLQDVCFIDEQAMCAMLARLPNLRELSLDNCKGAATDKTLATIFEHQTRLRVLCLDHCSSITDGGFLGVGQRPYGIARLRGLNKLTVQACRNLTDRFLCRALLLPELKLLKVDYCNRLETRGINALIDNCRGLESLSMASCFLMDDETVFLIVQGLKRLRSLTISNCSLMTLQAMHYIALGADNLRELTACDIDGLDVEAAEKILERHSPPLKQVLL